MAVRCVEGGDRDTQQRRAVDFIVHSDKVTQSVKTEKCLPR